MQGQPHSLVKVFICPIDRGTLWFKDYPCLSLRPCTRREQQARAQLQPLAGEISRWRSGKRAAGLWGEGRIKLWNPRLQQPNFINATYWHSFQAGVLSYTAFDGLGKWLSSLEIQGTHLELSSRSFYSWTSVGYQRVMLAWLKCPMVFRRA